MQRVDRRNLAKSDLRFYSWFIKSFRPPYIDCKNTVFIYTDKFFSSWLCVRKILLRTLRKGDGTSILPFLIVFKARPKSCFGPFKTRIICSHCCITSLCLNINDIYWYYAFKSLKAPINGKLVLRDLSCFKHNLGVHIQHKENLRRWRN